MSFYISRHVRGKFHPLPLEARANTIASSGEQAYNVAQSGTSAFHGILQRVLPVVYVYAYITTAV